MMMRKNLYCFVGGVLGVIPISMAVTINVNEGAVIEAEDGLCSLFEAIINANTDSQVFTAKGECPAGEGDDLIELPLNAMFEANVPMPSVTSSMAVNGNASVVETSNGLFDVRAGARLEIDEVALIGTAFFSPTLAIRNEPAGTVVVKNTTISGFRGGAIDNSGTMSLNNILITGNSTYSGVGGIWNREGTLTLTDSIVRSNGVQSFGGTGGLGNDSAGTVSILRSTIANNSTGSMVGIGGGISNSGNMDIRDSTISGNRARDSGGGIANAGTLALVNSTLSGNEAPFDGNGLFNTGEAELINVTIANDQPLPFESSSALINFDVLSMANSILVGVETGIRCENQGSIIKNVNNWIDDGSCEATFDGDAMLRPLGINGGSTQTHALKATSGAIDSGDQLLCPAADQRGVARLGPCDLGAFEFIELILDTDFELLVN